jgi:MFS family permease
VRKRGVFDERGAQRCQAAIGGQGQLKFGLRGASYFLNDEFGEGTPPSQLIVEKRFIEQSEDGFAQEWGDGDDLALIGYSPRLPFPYVYGPHRHRRVHLDLMLYSRRYPKSVPGRHYPGAGGGLRDHDAFQRMQQLPARMRMSPCVRTGGKFFRHSGDCAIDLLEIVPVRTPSLAHLRQFSTPIRFQARVMSPRHNGKTHKSNMTASLQSKRTLFFVNWAHALDHFVLLIFPTAVIAIAAELRRDYSDLIWLSTGSFVAFGLFALPVGWLADRFGRRTLLGWFFFGYGGSCILVALSTGFPMLAASLLLLGIFSAIYHPIGSSMIVANAAHMGRALGINGVWGNMGAALASGITAALAAGFGWRAAFLVPGALLVATGFAFNRLVHDDRARLKLRPPRYSLEVSKKELVWLGIAFTSAILAGGITFNFVTISMPKVIDERLGFSLPLALTGWVTTAIFFCGAITQIMVGRLIDRFEPAMLFIWLSIMQPIGLVLAAATTGLPMAIGLILVMAAIYGQVVTNDAMIGRYIADEYRNRFYSLRFFAGFTVGGLAVPFIGTLREHGGFTTVLLTASAVAVVIVVSAFATWALTRGRTQLLAAPAE